MSFLFGKIKEKVATSNAGQSLAEENLIDATERQAFLAQETPRDMEGFKIAGKPERMICIDKVTIQQRWVGGEKILLMEECQTEGSPFKYVSYFREAELYAKVVYFYEEVLAGYGRMNHRLTRPEERDFFNLSLLVSKLKDQAQIDLLDASQIARFVRVTQGAKEYFCVYRRQERKITLIGHLVDAITHHVIFSEEIHETPEGFTPDLVADYEEYLSKLKNAQDK